jgi:hypothetical protein
MRQNLSPWDESAFWQKLVLSEEERAPWTTVKWDRSYRWFQSPNVIPLERYRSPAEWSRICAVLLRGRR